MRTHFAEYAYKTATIEAVGAGVVHMIERLMLKRESVCVCVCALGVCKFQIASGTLREFAVLTSEVTSVHVHGTFLRNRPSRRFRPCLRPPPRTAGVCALAPSTHTPTHGARRESLLLCPSQSDDDVQVMAKHTSVSCVVCTKEKNRAHHQEHVSYYSELSLVILK